MNNHNVYQKWVNWNLTKTNRSYEELINRKDKEDDYNYYDRYEYILEIFDDKLSE